MGVILNDMKEDGTLHAEARQESFSIYTDFGDQGFEVEYKAFEELEHLMAKLKPYYEKWKKDGRAY